MPTSLALALLVTATAFAAAAIGILGASILTDVRMRQSRDTAAPGDPAVFLFDDRDLIDASAPARSLLRTLPPGTSDWQRLTAFLHRHFPDFSGIADMQWAAGGVEYMAEDGSRLELSGGAGLPIRVVLGWNREGADEVAVDRFCLLAQEDEIARLRQIGEALNLPVWATGPDDGVVWANAAYLRQIADLANSAVEDLTWPLPNLLDRLGEADKSAGVRQLRLGKGSERAPQWFRVDTTDMDGGKLHVATPADALVRAQTTRDDLMQTLAKTFAELPIGLAVFDRQRQLTLFNPSLTELTSVGPEFLLARPTLFAFLDRLREARMIPEPRDYHGWRQALADIEKAASAGTYDDTWNLPSGVTYRVSARPHPDGALALWFEDVSADVTMARRFRSEIQTCQEVVEELRIAVAVFSPAGLLTLSNSSFAGLWCSDADARVAAVGIADLAADWQSMTEPSPLWADLVHFVRDTADQSPCQSTVKLLSGQPVAVRAARLGSGATMVEFRTADNSAAALPTETRRRAVARA